MLPSESPPTLLGTPLKRLFLERLLIASVVFVVLFVGIAKWQLYPRIEALQVSLNTTLANNIAASATRTLKRPEISVAAAIPNFSRSTSAEADIPLLQQLVNSDTSAESAYVLTRDGRIRSIAFSPAGERHHVEARDRIGLDMSRSPMFVNRDTERASLSPLFNSSVSEKLTLAVTAPLQSGCTLVMEISLDRLAQSVSNTTVDSDIRVLIVDSAGQLLVSSERARAGESVVMPVEFLQATQGTAAATFQLHGQDWFASSASVGQLDWRVVVMRPLASVYAPINHIITYILGATIVLLAFSTAMLMLTTRGMQRATHILISDANQFAKGGQPRPHTFKIRELAALDASLRFMARTLAQREELLRQANEALEMRVQERTHHLDEANAELATAMLQLQATQGELVQAGKMAALGSMVAGVAHEINTPVGNARLVASTLQDRARDLTKLLASTNVSRKEIDQIATDVLEASSLIDLSLCRAANLVRSFKQVAADQTSNQRRSFKLIDVAEENKLLLSPRLSQTGTLLVIEMAPNIEMESYPGDVGQVLTNLVENAIIHAYGEEGGGRIELTAHCRNADTVRMIIRDFGRGISPKNVERVFDPFFTTRMGLGGTGLGLAIVYSIVTQSLGGKITVESIVGHGTVFVIDLPLVAPLQATAPIPESF